LGFGCQIPNAAANLFLNFKACISGKSDSRCTASGAKAGSAASVYIYGRLEER
jgi:hypothetical protein